jgi:regulator of sigma E protease
MAVIGQGLGGLWNLAFTVLAFLLVLTPVVFFHELGHFLVARWCGVKVKAFSIGFGRELFGFNDRHGTRWRFALLPLGGYVKFVDDDNPASAPSREALERLSPAEREGALQAQPPSKRAAILAAGPLANFLLAIVIYALTFGFIGEQLTEARVDEVIPDMPAAAAGFKSGDLIVGIDGEAIESFADVLRIVSTSPNRQLAFDVDRGGRIVQLTATPKLSESTDRLGNKFARGIVGIKPSSSPDAVEYKQYGPIEAVQRAVKKTYTIIAGSLTGIYDLIMQRVPADQMRGPLGIAEMSGQVATLGPAALLEWLAFISVAIGFINLFPIPLLDGGHLVFCAIEAIRRRPLSERAQEIVQPIGLVILALLFVFVTFQDVRRILSKFLAGLG